MNICNILRHVPDLGSFKHLFALTDFLESSIEAFDKVFITNTVDGNNLSLNDDILIIKPEYSSDLDYYQDIYSNISNLLNQEAMVFCEDLVSNHLSENRNYIVSMVENSSITCVYFPHLGFLINIKSNGETNISFSEESLDSVVSFLKLEIVFISINSGIFCKSLRMRHLDDVYGDIHSKIKDIELDICHRFITENFPMKKIRIFHRIWYALSELDAILSLCNAIDKFHLTKPILSPSKTLDIKNGRLILSCYCEGT